MSKNLSSKNWQCVLSSTLMTILGIVCFRYGPAQLPVLITGACLGSLPLVFGCRRSNLFAFALLPYLIYLPGWYQPLTAFLGLR